MLLMLRWEADSFAACLSHLSIDHACLSRRSRAPTASRNTSNVRAPITLFPYITLKLFAYPISFLFRRLWPPPTPRIAIVFSLLLPNSFTSRSSNSSFPLTHPVPPCVFHIILLCESFSLLWCHTGTYVHPRPPPDYCFVSFFFLVGPGPILEIPVSAFLRSPLGR